MPGDAIAVVGISPRVDSIGPAGLHLRWSFPSQRGFPPGGFNIYRRPEKTFKPNQKVPFATFPTDQPLPPERTVGIVRFVLHPNTAQIICRSAGGGRFLAVTPLLDSLLELRFSQPVAQVQMEMDVALPSN